MRRYLSALAVALVALSGAARVYSTNLAQSTLPIVIGYDLDSTSALVYPVALGPTSVPSTLIRPQAVEGWYEPRSQTSTIDRRIKTANYDPTVVSCTDSSSSLEPVSAGDLIATQDVYGRPVYASIFSKASADSVEFDRSVDLTQSGCAAYRYRKLVVGSAIYDGWFSVAGWGYNTVLIDVAQLNVTGGINLQVECTAAHALTAAQVLASSNITAAGGYAVAIPEPWDICRVGLQIGTADDGTDTTTAAEKISVYAIRR